jgi:hypothetical protein
MAAIHNAQLEIIPVEGHRGRRVVRVSYDLITSRGDDLVGLEVKETIQVHGLNMHDAPVEPNIEPVTTGEASLSVTEGSSNRSFERAVHRSVLDVEQDWWSTGLGGEVQAIAEWVDHLVADIRLTRNGETIDFATTPVVTGSWGALGSD